MSTALFSGTHDCAAATSSGTALRPLIARHAVTADQRARAVPDSTPLREPERHPEEAESAENSVMIARTHRGVTSASWIFP